MHLGFEETLASSMEDEPGGGGKGAPRPLLLSQLLLGKAFMGIPPSVWEMFTNQLASGPRTPKLLDQGGGSKGPQSKPPPLFGSTWSRAWRQQGVPTSDFSSLRSSPANCSCFQMLRREYWKTLPQHAGLWPVPTSFAFWLHWAGCVCVREGLESAGLFWRGSLFS